MFSAKQHSASWVYDCHTKRGRDDNPGSKGGQDEECMRRVRSSRSDRDECNAEFYNLTARQLQTSLSKRLNQEYVPAEVSG